MPEEEELFEEKSDDSDEASEKILNEEIQESTTEESAESLPDADIQADSSQSSEAGLDGESEEAEEEAGDEGESEEDQEEASSEGDGDEEAAFGERTQAEMGDGEKPFTIAQLAKAKIERKIQPKRFGVLRVKEEKGDSDDAGLGVPEGQLAIDVYETDSEVVLKSTIAGVKPEDLDIGIEDNTVNIRGSRHQEDKIEGDNYFYQECYWGTFSRSVILPVEVDSEKVEASLKDGILTIRLPKIIREKEKKIRVSAD